MDASPQSCVMVARTLNGMAQTVSDQLLSWQLFAKVIHVELKINGFGTPNPLTPFQVHPFSQISLSKSQLAMCKCNLQRETQDISKQCGTRELRTFEIVYRDLS